MWNGVKNLADIKIYDNELFFAVMNPFTLLTSKVDWLVICSWQIPVNYYSSAYLSVFLNSSFVPFFSVHWIWIDYSIIRHTSTSCLTLRTSQWQWVIVLRSLHSLLGCPRMKFIIQTWFENLRFVEMFSSLFPYFRLRFYFFATGLATYFQMTLLIKVCKNVLNTSAFVVFCQYHYFSAKLWASSFHSHNRVAVLQTPNSEEVYQALSALLFPAASITSNVANLLPTPLTGSLSGQLNCLL